MFAEQRRSCWSETRYTQPALFALEYALAELWRSWGVEPAVVLGTASGSTWRRAWRGYSAWKTGCELVAARGRLMQALPGGGAMVAVLAAGGASGAAVAAARAGVSIAAVNGPEHVVIRGGAEEVEAMCGRCRRRGVRSRRLQVSHAFHSALMDAVMGRVGGAAGRKRMPKAPVRMV